MRRLPIYFLIDVSESMIGEPIEQVQEGVANIIKELRKDPYALETVYLSIIVFAGKAQKLTSLIELVNFYPPKLPIGGGTSLGNALNYLIQHQKLRETGSQLYFYLQMVIQQICMNQLLINGIKNTKTVPI